MKLIDKFLDKIVSGSTVVMETAIGTVELGYQVACLAKAVAHIALVVDNHAAIIKQLQEFHKHLVQGLDDGNINSVINDELLDDNAKKRLN